MRVLVTGKTGQIVTALLERAGDTNILPVGRPELDLARAEGAGGLLAAMEPDVIVSAAAYTSVDKAETEPELAQTVNGEAPGHLATVAAELGIPIIHISTDYVFDGQKSVPYVETDATRPLGAYGRSKLAGERAVIAGTANHVILRTAWVYSPFGGNFLKTMLRLASDRPEVRVVRDQLGSPTSALDIADAVLAVGRNLVNMPDEAALRGTFHMTAGGEASWADFACAIMTVSGDMGGPNASITAIDTVDYPTPARRPANSRLSSAKLAEVHGVELPVWQDSLCEVVSRLVRP
ncbi:dTDP-4-dehydrorhamnose reductase [Devosia nitrariae]|uniref:dTDP-4-dehydrorhamnose reductase n=1 Tax=Devosia nitrariae TaxID=2071872 RepID=A0ABQ5W1P4_9HYPH|nr:dTDP-4-dehydrorhamnose reductase [Devosia nitrariae]GLQ53641.1 NAD(P)-dependent oxidoreductase [Devosia nitrariae]